MPAKRGIDDWIRDSLTEEPPRSKSLIMTIFGDSLRPYVPSVWLSELIALLQPFQVNSQLTRTSAFRLAEEGWVQSRREGRRSLYSLTESGRLRVEHADQRIYELPPGDWDGQWTLVILTRSKSSPAARVELRQELAWAGFGLVASGIFAHPRANRGNLKEVLRRLGLEGEAVVLQARDVEGIATSAGRRLALECWNCDRVAQHYNGFLQQFEIVERLLEDKPEPEIAYVVQTLLIHAFRRVVLHDPQLPAALLPNEWPGHAAYDLCRRIYRRTFVQTRLHLAAVMHAARELDAAPSFYARLGGLSNIMHETQGRRQ